MARPRFQHLQLDDRRLIYRLSSAGLRRRLIKIAVLVEDLKTRVKLHLPRSTPDQTIFGLVLSRMPKLVV